MILTRHHRSRGHARKGYTLIEVSSAMSVTIVLAIALVIMLQQHIAFIQMFQKQAFLAEEAPKIGNLLGRIINQADHYFIYATKEDALNGGAPVQVAGQAVRLFFKTAGQETTERLITMETVSSSPALRFYTRLANGSLTSWTISSSLASADFINDQGILSMTLTGPNGEQVTYGGGAK